MHITAVVGSLTPGEMARRAMSVSWRRPNSGSCAKLRWLVTTTQPATRVRVRLGNGSSTHNSASTERGVTKSPAQTASLARPERSASVSSSPRSRTSCT